MKPVRGCRFATAITGLLGLMLLSGCPADEPAEVGRSPVVDEVEIKPARVEEVAAGKDGVLALAYPTGVVETSVLLIEARRPVEARVGKPYNFDLQVTNLRDNLALENVFVGYALSEGAQIIDYTAPGVRHVKTTASDNHGEQQQTAAGKNQDQKGQGQKSQKQQGQNEQDQSDRHQNRGGWMIDRLGPGESKTISITAVGQEEGTAATCIGVSYNPALCLTTKFVKSELQLVTVVPEVIDLCTPIAVQYTIRNVGTAAARGVVLREALPAGLETADAQNVLALEVGDLDPGAERVLSQEFIAAGPGEYRVRPTAVIGDEVVVQAREAFVGVREVRLTANIEGPPEEYVNEPMTYEITVTNAGDAAAVNTKLAVELSAPLTLLRTTPAAALESGGWNLGTIPPGESRKVRLTAIAREGGTAEVKAVAASVCAREIAGARTVATAASKLIALPALLLQVVDQVDPVSVGEETAYSITVVNQGSGPDQNVQLSVQLPESLELLDVKGTTEGKVDGKQITLGALDELGAGESADWLVTARGVSKGDVRTRVELTSQYLSRPVPDVEPTRVIE